MTDARPLGASPSAVEPEPGTAHSAQAALLQTDDAGSPVTENASLPEAEPEALEVGPTDPKAAIPLPHEMEKHRAETAKSFREEAAKAAAPKAADRPKSVAPAEGRASAAGFTCGYFDVVLVGRLQDELLRGLARAALKKVEGNPFKDVSDVAATVLSDLQTFLQKQLKAYDPAKERQRPKTEGSEEAEPESIVLLTLSDWLNTFCAAKRSVLSVVASVFVDEDEGKVAATAAQLQQRSVWPMAQREELTLQLIRTIDHAGRDHCRFHCSSGEELAAHKSYCPIRPVTCPFPNCNQSFKASHFVHHDRRCPHKPVPCSQGCAETVPRQDMAAHCNGPCSHKPMVCPFQAAGCATKHLLQGGYTEHLHRQVPQHLQQVYGVVCDQGARMQQHAQRTEEALLAVDALSKSTPQGLKALKGELGDQHKALEKKLSSLQKEATDDRKEIAELKKAVADLRKENAALKKAVQPQGKA